MDHQRIPQQALHWRYQAEYQIDQKQTGGAQLTKTSTKEGVHLRGSKKPGGSS